MFTDYNLSPAEKAFENKVHMERFALVIDFLNLKLGNNWANSNINTPAELLGALKDGHALCKLVGIDPVPIPETSSEFSQEKFYMQNLNKFRAACKNVHIPESSLFATSDLLEPTSLSSICVVNCLQEVRMKFLEHDRALLNQHFSPSGSASKKRLTPKQLSFHSPVIPIQRNSPLTVGRPNAGAGGLLEILPNEAQDKITPRKASPRTPPSPALSKRSGTSSSSRRVSVNTLNVQASVARVNEKVATAYKERCKQLEAGHRELLESVEDLQATISSLQRSKHKYQFQAERESRANSRLMSNWKLIEAQITSCFDEWQNVSQGSSGDYKPFDNQITLLQRTWKDILEENEAHDEEDGQEPLDELCEDLSKLAVGKSVDNIEKPHSVSSENNSTLQNELVLTKDILKKSKEHIFALESELKAEVEKRQQLSIAATEQLSELKFELANISNDFRSAFNTSANDINAWSQELMTKVASQQKEMDSLRIRFKKEETRRKQLLNTVHNLKGNIRVMCRIRPVLASDSEKPDSEVAVEAISDERLLLTTLSKSATGTSKTKSSEFEFDRVFGANSKQNDVFDEVQPLVESVMDGFQACIFAYGQTGSGKTFTMSGTPEVEGINFLALRDLFELRDQRQATGSKRYTFTVRNVEIYCEKVIDLLGTQPEIDETDEQQQQQNFIDIRFNERDGVTMHGVVEENVDTVDEVVDVMERGAQNRTSSHTKMNMESSRSHSVVMINVRGEDIESGKVTKGKLVLVDLAGSERLNKSGVSGEQLKEAQSINKSLSCLGDVISALESKAAHIPFRNSKLTMLLQDSLGKDNKALMILQVSPTSYNAQESLCSLNFAARVRTCELGKAKKHEKAGESAAARQARKEQQNQMQALSNEVTLLKRKLDKAKEAVNTVSVSKDADMEKMKERLKERYESIAKTDQLEIKSLRDKLTDRDICDRSTTEKLENELHAAKLEIGNLKQQLKSSISSGFATSVSSVRTSNSSSTENVISSRLKSRSSRAVIDRNLESQNVLQERRSSLDNITSSHSPEKSNKKQVSWKNSPVVIQDEVNTPAEENNPSRVSRRGNVSTLGTASRVLQTPGKNRTALRAQRVLANAKSKASSTTRTKWHWV